jgi:hypothetical protein
MGNDEFQPKRVRPLTNEQVKCTGQCPAAISLMCGGLQFVTPSLYLSAFRPRGNEVFSDGNAGGSRTAERLQARHCGLSPAPEITQRLEVNPPPLECVLETDKCCVSLLRNVSGAYTKWGKIQSRDMLYIC